VSDADLVQVKQTSEQLKCKHFHFQSWHLPALCAVFLNRLVQIQIKVIHHHIQVLLVAFVSVKTVFHFEGVGVIQSLKNLQFSVFVLFILEHTLYCHNFECTFISGFMHDTESSCANFVFEDVSGGTLDWGLKFKEIFTK
jgi:hypothetical protein